MDITAVRYYMLLITLGLATLSDVSATNTTGLPVITITQLEHFSTIGVDVDLPCDVYASPALDFVTWYMYIGEFTVEELVIDEVSYSGGDTTQPSLTVLSPALNDSGRYYCMVSNSFGSVFGNVLTLLVTETTGLPIVTMTQNSYTVGPDDNVTLGCSIVSNPILYAVEWRVNGSQIFIDDLKYYGGTNTDPSLLIISVQVTEGGNYTCEGTNSFGSVLKSTTLNVVSALPNVTAPLTLYTPTEGDSVTLVCNIEATPAVHTVSWQQDGFSVGVDGLWIVGSTPSTPSLTIHGIQYYQSGLYECTGISSFGSNGVNITVNVLAATTASQTTDATAEATTIADSTIAEATDADTTVTGTTVADTTIAEATVADTTVAEATVADTTVAEATVADSTIAEATVADTTVVDTTIAETTVAEVTVADTTIAEATIADTTVADPTVAIADTTVAETTVADTTIAEATAADTTIAEATVADTTVAETTVADTTVAEATVADTTIAEAPVADTTVAETTVADTTVAEATVADTTIAEATFADNTVAETTVAIADTTVAETTVADTTIAEATVADTTIAETTEADTTVAETTVADTTVAETTVADITVAETTVADTTVAETTVADKTTTTALPTTTITTPTTTTASTTTKLTAPTGTPSVDHRLVDLDAAANGSTSVSGVTTSITTTLNVLNTLTPDKDISAQLIYVASIMESNLRVTTSLNGSAEQNKEITEEFLKLTDKVSSLSHTCIGICQNVSESFSKVETTTVAMIKKVLDSDEDYNNSYSNVYANCKKESGDELPDLSTDVGGVTLPQWGTLQKTLAEEKVKLIMLTYKENPYHTSRSSDVSINSGVLTIGLYHDNNDRVNYVDSEDPMTLSVAEKPGVDGIPAAEWENVQELQTERGSYLTVVTFTSEKTAAIAMLRLPGTGPCAVYGKDHGEKPSASHFDFYIKTTGLNRVTKYRPFWLEKTYRDGVLSISVEGTVDTSPLVILTQCQVPDSTIAKRDTSQTLTQRVVGVDLRYFDTASQTWQKTSDLKITSGSTGKVNFKSNFFGSFSASTLLIPPTPIAFDAIFLNFGERLASTPHVLVTIIAVLILFILLTLVLRGLDRSDAELWNYLPLIDNRPGHIFLYYFAVATGLSSSKRLTATVYINMIGEFAESGPRILVDGRRKNFGRGSTSHFVMATENYLGPIQSVKVWHDNVGSSPRWLLNKIIVCDGMDNERYVFGCGKWLSMDTDDALVSRTLHMIDESLVDMDVVFVDVSTRYMFDENLWFSLPKRPSFSRFTRVQRLWLLAAILFLSMITSAMFFRSSSDDSRSVTLGPIRLNYKQIYVGFLSFLITILPSFVVVYIFKYRKCRNEMRRSNSGQKEKENCLPWWSVFIAYGIIFLGIASGGFFTMLYSLEWGRDVTVDWMMSFFVGIILSIFIMEPCKAACMAIVMTMLCTGAAQRTMTEIPSSDSMRIAHGDWYLDTSYVTSPKVGGSEKADLHERRRRCRLDKRLNSVILSWLLHFLYIFIVAIICSHNQATMAYHQNVALGNKISSNSAPKTVAEVWNWLEKSLIDNLFPFKHYNNDIMTSNEQQSADQFYRLGLIRLRQARVQGSCNIPSMMQPWLTRCPPEMASETEDRNTYCIGWANYNTACFNEIDDDQYAYTYKTDTETESLYHIGLVDSYDGGGYVRDIGHTHKLALNTINRLRDQTWIDDKTRALFVDGVFLNGDDMLFSHIKVVFEFPSFGGVFMKIHKTTSNLYPYVGSLDYLVLIFQVIFVVIVCVRIVLLVISVIKTKCYCLTTLSTWITILEITLSLAAISVFILRIDRTIDAIERVFNDIGFFVSFEMVEMLDILYRMFIGSVCFIAILNLLKPLSFNYYLHLMRTAISMFRSEVLNFSTIAILCIVAFSCLIYLIYGYIEPGFKDFQTTFLYLFRIMIGMIHFREIIVNENIGLTIILGVYITIATILTINFFLAGLNFVFTEARERSNTKGKYQFDDEINKHFWWKMSSVASKVLGTNESVLKRRKSSYKETGDDKVESLTEEIDFILSSITDRVLAGEDEEDRVEVRKLAHINRWYNNQQDVVELECFRTDIRTSTEFIYEDKFGQLVCKLTGPLLGDDDGIFGASMSILTSKWSNLYPCGQAARPCSKVILLTQNLTNGQTGVISVAVTDKSGLYYGQNDLPLFMVSSFDGGVSWEIRTAWRRTVENYPCVCCDLPSCPTHLVAVSCDQWPYLPLRLKGHWESWTIDSSSYNLQTVFPKLSISFDSGSIEDRASIFLILEQTDFLPTVHFLSSEDFILPITLKFSCTGSESDLPRKVFVLMQDGDLKWSRKETITIIPEIGELKIQVQNIKKGVRRAIAVVPSDLNSFSMSVFGIKRYNGMLNYSSHRLINELLNSTSTDNNG